MGVLATLKRLIKGGDAGSLYRNLDVAGDYTTNILGDMMYRGYDAAMDGKDMEKAMRDAYRVYTPKRLWQNTTSGERTYSTSNPSNIWGLRENWQEVPGPLPKDYSRTLSEDEAMDLLTGDNGRLLRKEYGDHVKEYQKYVDDIKKNASMFGFDPNELSPEDLANEESMLKKKLEALKRMDTPDEQIMLDPQMYMGEEYAPWIRSKASKYINGEY